MPEIHSQAPQDTEALITHIRAYYHERHRKDLSELLPLARRVDDVHWGDLDLPHGLADLVEDLSRDLETHMAKEEDVLFPLMLQGKRPTILQPLAAMRRDHQEQERNAKSLATLTHGFTPPKDACGSWRRLYTGLAQVAADLDQHLHLENDILFPRFKRQAEEV